MLKNYTTTSVKQHRRTNPYTGVRNSSHVSSHDRLLSNRAKQTFQSSRKYKDLANKLKNKKSLSKKSIDSQRKKYLMSANLIDKLGIKKAKKLI